MNLLLSPAGIECSIVPILPLKTEPCYHRQQLCLIVCVLALCVSSDACFIVWVVGGVCVHWQHVYTRTDLSQCNLVYVSLHIQKNSTVTALDLYETNMSSTAAKAYAKMLKVGLASV